MWKKLMIKIGKLFLNWGANLLWNYVDTNKDGSISQKELHTIYKKVKKILKK